MYTGRLGTVLFYRRKNSTLFIEKGKKIQSRRRRCKSKLYVFRSEIRLNYKAKFYFILVDQICS